MAPSFKSGKHISGPQLREHLKSGILALYSFKLNTLSMAENNPKIALIKFSSITRECLLVSAAAFKARLNKLILF